MNMSAKEDSAIQKIFSGICALKIEPWKSLWIDRLIQYIFIFDVVAIIGFIVFWILNLAPTTLDNSRYLLSGVVQVQAAIISLVITFTLIAIQMASSSYTPRVVDVMKKNPDMWFLLIIYLGSISYGFVVLKFLSTDPDPILVSSVFILGLYTFLILFLYMKNTISLLRPDEIVKILVLEITAENIHEINRTGNNMQSVFDVIHSSIMRYDITTTTTGLEKITDQILEIYASLSISDKKDVINYICSHIQRSSLIALNNNDERILIEINMALKKIGINCLANRNSELMIIIIKSLKSIGTRAASKGLDDSASYTVETLETIGRCTACWGMEDATSEIAMALEDIGILSAKGQLRESTMFVAKVLGRVGFPAAYKKMYSTMRLVIALEKIGIIAIDSRMIKTVSQATESLSEIARHSSEQKHEDLTQRIRISLYNLGIHAVEKKMEETTIDVAIALENVGIYAAKNKLRSTSQVAKTIEKVGIHSANKKLFATSRFALALETISYNVAIHEGERNLSPYVHGLCSLGCRIAGQEAAAKSLASLLQRFKILILEMIDVYKSQLHDSERNQFNIFIEKASVEFNKPIPLIG